MLHTLPLLGLTIGFSLGNLAAAATPLNANLPLNPLIEGYRLQDAFPTLTPEFAIKIYSPLGDTNRLFLAAKRGVITVITNLSAPTASQFLDLSGKTYAESESGLLGLVFHPGWTTNRQLFVYYSTLLPQGGTNALHQRVSRFTTAPDNPNVAVPESEVPLFSQLDPEASHQGGDLHFGPDGYLYLSVGDGGGAWDSFQNSQKIDAGFFGGVLRLDVDSREGSLPPNPHPGVNSGAYRIPPDNPFVGVSRFLGKNLPPETVRTEFWAVGLRNPYRMAFHPVTGDLYANDTGQNRREEINRLSPGGNYGWVFFEGSLVWPFGVPAGEEFAPPIFEYEHEQGKVAITGGHWYSGDRYPELNGAYVFADFGGPIGALHTREGAPPRGNWFSRLPGVADIATHPRTGHLLFSELTSGRVMQLEPAQSGSDPIPSKLSQTGLFSDLGNLTPATGLIPYDLNHPFWSDLAIKRRWVGLMPGADKFGFARDTSWQAPVGAVWVKHFDLDTNESELRPRRRIETRVLVRNRSGVWGASYRWREDGSDADLVDNTGLEEDIRIQAAPHGPLVRTQRWRYSSREECLACHNPSAGHALGFNTAQLNVITSNGNQLNRLADMGYIDGLPADSAPLPKLVPLDDLSSGVSHRARSYLEANCAYCHLPGGPTRATWDARMATPLHRAGIVGVTALNNLGDVYGIIPTQIAFPAKPEQSAIFLRIADFEPYHMPPLGTAVVNTNAVELVKAWINGPLAEYSTFSSWQLRYFGSTNVLGARDIADPDEDGMNNESEWILGENPTSSNRNWKLHALEESGYLVLRFERRSNFIVQLESGDPFGGSAWELVSAPGNEYFEPATPSGGEIRIPLGTAENRYYRLRFLRL